ncbi:MAG TPA: KilA-N domain-containing protein, partial [Clostridia bacterium]|nr:KilA-N domain-containing protein [Clostridia bacterium]
LIHNKLTKAQIGITYADEADLLNVALFGSTAKEWKINNPDKDGNMRDYATIEELIVMANLESANAQFIAENVSQAERLKKLNQMARFQLKSLLNNSSLKKLEGNKSIEK